LQKIRGKINLNFLIIILLFLLFSFGLFGQYYYFQQQINVLNAAEQTLKEENVKLSEAIENLQQEIETLKTENEKLNEENRQLKTENQQLKTLAAAAAKPIPLPSPNNAKTVYLTFDDGPSENTFKILDTLKEYKVKATFFLNGKDSHLGRTAYKRIAEEGHALGNHTYSHVYSQIYTSVDAYMSDTEKLNDLLYETTGIRPKIIRFPGGSNNLSSVKYGGKTLMQELTKEVETRGYRYFDWNVVANDTIQKVVSKQAIINSVLNGVNGKNTAVILFHDSPAKTTTADALPAIIQELKKEGCEFKILTADTKPIHFLN